MSDLSPTDLNRAKARALDVALALDRLRDEVRDERELASAIVTTLAEAVEAELCLLCLRDDDTGELQLRAVIDRAGVYGAPAAEGELRALAQRAAEAPLAQLMPTDLVLGDHRLTWGLASPLRLGQDSLGAVLLLNTDRPFSPAEQVVVQTAISQIDSAMQHARTLRDLARRQKELETIYRIDRLRDRTPDLQALLDAVLAEVVAALETETGFIMLYDQAGNELEMRATTGRDLFSTEDAAQHIRQLADEAVRDGHLISRRFDQGALRLALGMPLILRNNIIGVLGVANPRGDGDAPAFTRSDLQLLRAVTSQIDTAIFESLQTQRLRGAFGQSVGPAVMERLLTIADRDLLSGDRRQVTTLFSDIRGFTAMTGQLDPELLQAVLNDHLSALTDVALAYEGTVDKYIGDSVMCFFNAPEEQPDHALRAVRLACDMRLAHHEVMARWRARVPLPHIGIGISTGPTTVGNFGSLRRLEYTAIGPDVNLAARLCAAAEGDQVLISQATYAAVAERVDADLLPPVHLKGIEGVVECWNLRGLK